MKRRDTVDIHELIDLLHIPVIEKRLYLKIEELKSSEYENKIELYKQKVENYKNILFENKPLEDTSAIEKRGQTYWFELTRFKECKWQVTRLEPELPPYLDILEIIPPDIIKLIDLSLTNPDKIESRRNILSTTFHIAYDLEFVRCSDNHALGTICSTCELAQSPGIKLHEKTYIESECSDFELKSFFSYMQKIPTIRTYFLNEFFSKIKFICEEENENIIVS
ncbi:MAG: hypothetical protein L0Y73_04870 [Candidatus Aminicenantes bacterium]|nr:hypothetical protein [Candidatus Aminicenantes bacterium]